MLMLVEALLLAVSLVLAAAIVSRETAPLSPSVGRRDKGMRSCQAPPTARGTGPRLLATI